MNRRRNPHAGRQRGAVLMVGMVMLMMLTLMAVALIRLSTFHTQVVGNEQVRTEAVAAANFALDMVLNEPQSKWAGYAGDSGTVKSVNLGTVQTGDGGANELPVRVKRLECKRGRVLKNAELLTTDTKTGVTKVKDDADKPCIFGGSNSHLTFGNSTSSGDSLCATVLWELQAQAESPRLLAAAQPVNQGVEVRADVGNYMDACK